MGKIAVDAAGSAPRCAILPTTFAAAGMVGKRAQRCASHQDPAGAFAHPTELPAQDDRLAPVPGSELLQQASQIADSVLDPVLPQRVPVG
ncbi:MAG TPA: hypothetical protein VGF60_19810, partial [Xanthobacteraceae bacterium]